MSDDGASSSALPSPQAAQSPEEAAEALRLLSEAQHGHQAVIESINGEAAGDDELDDDDEHELGVCNAQEVLEAYARCRERETLRTYRSAVTAFTNWLVTVKDNLEVKAMVAKILKHSGTPPTYCTSWISRSLPSRSKGQPICIVGILCRSRKLQTSR